MANILKTLYVNNGFAPNVGLKEITITLDDSITTSDINTYLSNNGSRYNSIESIGFIPSGSSATILTPLEMLVCTFIAESGTVNSTTGFQEGTWKCLAKIAYK